jgi:outer membrane protein, heavy metal efflux system
MRGMDRCVRPNPGDNDCFKGGIMIRLSIMLLALGMSAAFSTPSSRAITLEEAVTAMLHQNPELQTLRLEAESARGQLDRARMPFVANPILESFGSRKQRLPEEGSGSVTNYGVKLSQEFEVAGQRGIRIDVAQKNLARIALEIKDRERILGYEVKHAYAQTLAFKERVALFEEVVRLREDLLELTKTKYRAGDVSALKVNLAEVEASKARSDLLFVQQGYADVMLVLQGLTGGGTGAGGLPSVEGQLMPDGIVVPDKETLKRTLSERPDVNAAGMEAERTRRAEELVRREAIPNPSFGGFYNRDELKSDVGIALSVSIPLFDRKQPEKRQAKARTEQARIRQAGLGLSVEREFEQAYTNLSSSLRQLSVYKKDIIARSLENLGLLNLAFKEGKIGFFDVRLAQRDAMDLRFAYLDALLRAQQAIYAVERTIGGGLK